MSSYTSSLYLENLWNGIPGPVTGSTAFGYFEDDSDFIHDCQKFAILATRRLGYPIVQIELESGSIYSAYENAVMEYSNQVNQFNIKENLLMLQGVTSSINLTQTPVNHTLNSHIKVSQQYGAEIGLGTNIPIYSASFNLIANQQTYDLNNLDPRGNIEIRTVYYHEPPAVSTYFDPYLGSYDGYRNLIDSFGWDNMSPAIRFMMMPLNETLLRIQTIEMSNQIRKSGYSFEIKNNKIKIFPIPQYSCPVWLDYILVSERYSENNILMRGDNTSGSFVSDISNAPYGLMDYSSINSTGRQWIVEYGVAIVKEMLGNVRGKYANIPIPNEEISLDGDTLRNEAEVMKDKLIEQLRNILESMSRKALLEAKKEEAEQVLSTLSKIPTMIYIG